MHHSNYLQVVQYQLSVEISQIAARKSQNHSLLMTYTFSISSFFCRTNCIFSNDRPTAPVAGPRLFANARPRPDPSWHTNAYWFNGYLPRHPRLAMVATFLPPLTLKVWIIPGQITTFRILFNTIAVTSASPSPPISSFVSISYKTKSVRFSVPYARPYCSAGLDQICP